jgi:L-2-hydroxycarboxylate dehydrogenase (NAD+)
MPLRRVAIRSNPGYHRAHGQVAAPSLIRTPETVSGPKTKTCIRGMLISSEEAASVAVRALMNAGVPEASAQLQAELLVDSEQRGLRSHGLLRLPRLVERIRNGVADPVTVGEHRWHGDALLLVHGANGLGPVVAREALREISERAKSTGIACASIASSNHLGALAWYVRDVAAAGQICIALTTSEAIMHPHGGRHAMVGSNPIAIGVPAHPRPLVLDMATSRISMGQVIDYINRGDELEPGWARDASGEPTTDPRAARDGSIAPVGGAKGYGLGIAFEVLVASLTGSALGTSVVGTLDSIHPANKGDVFIILNVPHASVVEQVSAYLNGVRASPAADTAEPIVVPGDRSDQRKQHAIVHGLDVSDGLWAQLIAMSGPAIDKAPDGMATDQ